MFSMRTVPIDGRVVRLHMPDGTSFLARPIDGLVDSDGSTCWNWGEVEEGTAPEDWSDGVCWGSNEDGVPSTYPVGWSPAETKGG